MGVGCRERGVSWWEAKLVGGRWLVARELVGGQGS